MEKIQYTEILQNAFKITRKHKLLWLFGFVVFLTLSNPLFNVDFRKSKDLIIILIIYLPFYIAKLFSTSALIKSGNDIALYSQLSLKQIIGSTKKYVFNLFITDFFLTITLLTTIALLLIPATHLLKQNYNFISGTFFLLTGLLIFLIAFLIYFLRKYAFLYIILGKLNSRKALIAAYDLFEQKLNQSIIMTLILLSLRLILFILVSITVLILAIPIVSLVFLGYIVLAEATTFWILLILVIAAIIPIIILFSIFEAFAQIAWTLFFQQISFEKNNQTKSEEVELDALPDPEVA